MEDDLEQIKISVNSFLTSQKSGASAKDIENFYKLLLGKELPYRRYNCRNAEDFIMQYMTDVTRVEFLGGLKIFMPVVMKEARHIADLVNRTKDSSKRLHKNDDIPKIGLNMGDTKLYGMKHSIHPVVRPSNPFSRERLGTKGAGEGHYQTGAKYSSQDERNADFWKDKIVGRKLINISTEVKGDKELASESLNESFNEFDSCSMKGFENLKISVEQKENITKRLVSLPDNSGKQIFADDPLAKKYVHSPCPMKNQNNNSNWKNPNVSEHSVYFTLHGQQPKFPEIIKEDDFAFIKSINPQSPEQALSPSPDRSVTLQSLITNQVFNSPMSSQTNDTLYSPMSTPTSSQLFSSSMLRFYVPTSTQFFCNDPSKSVHGSSHIQLDSMIQFGEGKLLQSSIHNPFSAPLSPLSPPINLFHKQPVPSPIQAILTGEDPSIIPPTTSSFSPSKLTPGTVIASTTKDSSSSSVGAPVIPPTPKFGYPMLVNGLGSTAKINHSQSNSSSDPSPAIGGVDDNHDMIMVTEVHSTSLVIGNQLANGFQVSFALTNLEDIGRVDLDYVRILLLNRHFRANFDYISISPQNSDSESMKCYGTLYKKNGPVWINMNLFILEETLDPQFVKKDIHHRPTYTVSELFSIRKKIGCYQSWDLVDKVSEEIKKCSQETNSDDVDVKLAYIHSFGDDGSISLDFLSLYEKEKTNGRTQVNCFLKGYSKDEVEWTPNKIMMLKDALKIGSKVIVKIFKRSCQNDPGVFLVDLRTFQQRFFATDIFKREPFLCPYLKVNGFDHPPKGERILVTHVRSLRHINALPMKYLESFGEMFIAMQDFYNKQRGEDIYLDKDSIERHLCGFKSKEDNLWYRGRIETTKDDLKIVVYSVDFGSYETLTQESIKDLPNNFRHLPLLSYFLKLSGTVDPNETKQSLERRLLHKVFRFFPSDPKQPSTGVLLTVHGDTFVVM